EQSIASLEQNIIILWEKVIRLEKRVKSLEISHSTLYGTVKHIDATVMKIEIEHGEKLQILFDADLTRNEKINDQAKMLIEQKNTLEHYADEIYFLKSKVQ